MEHQIGTVFQQYYNCLTKKTDILTITKEDWNRISEPNINTAHYLLEFEPLIGFIWNFSSSASDVYGKSIWNVKYLLRIYWVNIYSSEATQATNVYLTL